MPGASATMHSAVALITSAEGNSATQKRTVGSGAVSFAAVVDVYGRHDAALSSTR